MIRQPNEDEHYGDPKETTVSSGHPLIVVRKTSTLEPPVVRERGLRQYLRASQGKAVVAPLNSPARKPIACRSAGRLEVGLRSPQDKAPLGHRICQAVWSQYYYATLSKVNLKVSSIIPPCILMVDERLSGDAIRMSLRKGSR